MWDIVYDDKMNTELFIQASSVASLTDTMEMKQSLSEVSLVGSMKEKVSGATNLQILCICIWRLHDEPFVFSHCRAQLLP